MREVRTVVLVVLSQMSTSTEVRIFHFQVYLANDLGWKPDIRH